MNIFQQIKLLLLLKKVGKEIKEGWSKEVKMNGVKPGWKTTEFWLVVVANLMNVVGALKGLVKPEIATIAVTVLDGLYAILRTFAKKSNG